MPVLYIFSGLPGAGKTTIAQGLCRILGSSYLRIDTIEQALKDLCHFDVHAEGYHLAHRIAIDNLTQGVSVVADSCNPILLTRREWRQIAKQAGAKYIDIEIVCSDLSEHKARIKKRVSTITDLNLPSWEDVKNREYHQWLDERITIDTAKKAPEECISELMRKLR